MSLFKCICCGTINTNDKIALKCGCCRDDIISSAPNVAVIEHSETPARTTSKPISVPIRGNSNGNKTESSGNSGSSGHSSHSSHSSHSGSLVSSLVGSCSSLASYFRGTPPPDLTLFIDGNIRTADTEDLIPGLFAVCCRCTYVPRVHWQYPHACDEKFYRYHRYTSEYILWRKRLWEICGREYLREQHTAEYSIYTYYRGPRGELDDDFARFINICGDDPKKYLVTQRFLAFPGKKCYCCDEN